MINFIGLVLELFIIFGIPVLIPSIIVFFAGKISCKDKVKKGILFVLSIILNSIIGIVSPMFYFCLLIFLCGFLDNIKIVFLIIISLFGIIIIPINLYIIKKGKINFILYIILNSIVIVTSCIIGVLTLRGSFDL